MFSSVRNEMKRNKKQLTPTQTIQLQNYQRLRDVVLIQVNQGMIYIFQHNKYRPLYHSNNPSWNFSFFLLSSTDLDILRVYHKKFDFIYNAQNFGVSCLPSTKAKDEACIVWDYSLLTICTKFANLYLKPFQFNSNENV